MTCRSVSFFVAFICLFASPLLAESELSAAQREECFARAALHGTQANEQLVRCHRFVHGWLAQADDVTGLIPRNLDRDRDIWNAKDSAADNYPFMVLTAALTDRVLFAGRMLDMLHTETRLTSRIDRLPDTWSFSRQTFQKRRALYRPTRLRPPSPRRRYAPAD
jgi:hypothetical protein